MIFQFFGVSSKESRSGKQSTISSSKMKTVPQGVTDY